MYTIYLYIGLLVVGFCFSQTCIYTLNPRICRSFGSTWPRCFTCCGTRPRVVSFVCTLSSHLHTHYSHSPKSEAFLVMLDKTKSQETAFLCCCCARASRARRVNPSLEAKQLRRGRATTAPSAAHGRHGDRSTPRPW